MDETDKKIRELTEAMRAEQDARIRKQDDGGARNTRWIPHKGRGVLRRRGPAHGPAVGGAVSTRAASVASGTLPEGEGLHARGTGGSGNWPTGLPARTCSPPESFGTGYAGN